MMRWLMVFGLLTVALGGALVYQQRQSATGRSGFPAPDFALQDLSGQVHRLSDFRGKVVFLNVWATWCPPCRMEMPSMERLHRRMQGKDFVMLAVSEDEGGPAVVRPFVEELGLTFPVLIDERGVVPARFGVTGYPETFVIDRQGRVLKHVIGPDDWNTDEAYQYFLGLVEPDATRASGERAPAGS